eukprot:2363871-Alexandrium_andersonii.AAC.1
MRPWRLVRPRRHPLLVRMEATAIHRRGDASRSETTASGRTARASCMTSVLETSARMTPWSASPPTRPT